MNSFLTDKINQRIKNNSLRELRIDNHSLIDFTSNDYIGFSKSTKIKSQIQTELNLNIDYAVGSTGSRLLSGNTAYAEQLEHQIANFHQAQDGLLFNSGYDANVGLLSCIAQRGDTIICDELIHASLIDGARLSYANRYIYKHNDLQSLEDKLKNSKGNIFIVTESVFSMDGDFAPLTEIIALAKKYNAYLIVDEAHAIGVIGKKGKGLVQELNLQNDIFARVCTFGKALGCHGAIILGSLELKTYLTNFARSFIYTTALPFHSLACIKIAYHNLNNNVAIADLNQRIQYFSQSKTIIDGNFIESNSAIQSLIIPGNKACKAVASNLQSNGLNVKAILSPTVAEGKERLRICLHSFNTETEIKMLMESIKKSV